MKKNKGLIIGLAAASIAIAGAVIFLTTTKAGKKTMKKWGKNGKKLGEQAKDIISAAKKKYENLKGPVAQGDGPLWVPGKNPPESQFSVYGSAHVGIFGSIIRTTNVPGILQLNLLATDFYHDKAYPSFLYYNPYTSTKRILIKIEPGKKADLYNTVTGTFIAKNISSVATIQLPPRHAAVIVVIPSGGKLSYEANKMLVNDVVVDYNHNEKNK